MFCRKAATLAGLRDGTTSMPPVKTGPSGPHCPVGATSRLFLEAHLHPVATALTLLGVGTAPEHGL